MLARSDLGGIAAGKIVVHLAGHFLRLLPQFRGQFHPFPTPGLAVEDRAPGNRADEHFLQRHRLGTELQAVGVAGFGSAALVLHGQRLPQSVVSLKGNTVRGGAELHHIAVAGQPQPVADDPQIPHGDEIPALFPQRIIMAALMQQASLGGAQVFRPLLLHISQGPLAAAETEVLDAGHLQVVVRIHRRPRQSDRAANRR